MVGPHMQGNVDDWPDAVRILPAGAPVKVIDGVQRCVEAKGVNPDCITVVRHHVHEQDPQEALSAADLTYFDKLILHVNLTSAEVTEVEQAWYTERADTFFGFSIDESLELAFDYHDHARKFFASFVDNTFRDLAWSVDYVGEYNEYLANSQSEAERARWLAWATACVDVWKNEYRTQEVYKHIGLILAETAIGNDIPLGWAKLSHENRPWCVLGYHPYVPVWKGEIRPDDWLYYSGRWEQMDVRYREHGYTVRWQFGEFGAVGHNGPGWPNSLAASDGWRHKNVYNGDINAYKEMVGYWISRAAQTEAWKRGDVLGAVIFTSGGGSLWDKFELAQPHLSDMAQYVADIMADIPDPDPIDPDPDPDEWGLINGSFENRNWVTSPDRQQQIPQGWNLIIYNDEVDGRAINGRPECVHKLAEQLPENERPGGPDSLFIDDGGVITYKMFTRAVWKVELRQMIHGGDPGDLVTLIVPVQIHFDGRPNDYDLNDTVITVQLDNGEDAPCVAELKMVKELDRTWQMLTCEARIPTGTDRKLIASILVAVKWEHDTAVFLDGITLTKKGVDVGDLWQRILWDESIRLQTISLNPDAALQGAMLPANVDYFTPVQSEFWMTIDNIPYAAQGAENPRSGARRVYYAIRPNWNDVRHFTDNWGDDRMIHVVVDSLPQSETQSYPTRDTGNIKRLIVHHTAGGPFDSTVAIANYHVNTRGWAGIGYHYLINGAGKIEQTNYHETVSAHASYNNLDTIGISLKGSFVGTLQPPNIQLNSLAWLIDKLKSELSIEEVIGHKETNFAQEPGHGTQCPGDTWFLWKDSVI